MQKSILLILLIGLAGLNLAALGADPVNEQRLKDKLTPADVCCAVVAVHARTALVTARDTTSGKTFKFQVSDKAMLRGLQPGDAVQADFAAGQVAIQKYGADICCPIVR